MKRLRVYVDATIEGFDALAFKEAAQARVQAELAGLAPADKVRRIQELVDQGPFADMVKRWLRHAVEGGQRRNAA